MPIRKPRRTGFSFDPRMGRYRNLRTGRTVSAAEVRRGAELVIRKSARRVEGLAASLRSGTIGVTDFEIGLRQEIKATQLAVRMAAKGGREQMSQSDFGLAGQRIRSEYQYLARFSEQLAAGSVPLDGRFARRAASYPLGGRAAFAEVERGEQPERGNNFERNVIQAGESCSGCLEATALGVVPINSLVPPGSRDCLHNCRCVLVYSRSA